MAEVSKTFCCGSSPRLTETESGWGIKAAEPGLHELETGFECSGHYEGKHRSEENNPQPEADIRALVDPESQAYPKFKNSFAYTRITAKGVRKKLIEEKGWDCEDLPKERRINDMLNRLGRKPQRVQKTRPQKNSPNRRHL